MTANWVAKTVEIPKEVLTVAIKKDDETDFRCQAR
jgi:hypothetical protein